MTRGTALSSRRQDCSRALQVRCGASIACSSFIVVDSCTNDDHLVARRAGEKPRLTLVPATPASARRPTPAIPLRTCNGLLHFTNATLRADWAPVRPLRRCTMRTIRLLSTTGPSCGSVHCELDLALRARRVTYARYTFVYLEKLHRRRRALRTLPTLYSLFAAYLGLRDP
ncbi:hypothetical protein EXIGLDRAFT_420762 [Exidia glandulosa HHB12029]|uniref:Uncharacterized protein n=1 Tax=Exidia glandulosa HHB12029 TaxID=1314781 RepID=A0A165KLR3_EXIGL|nr:hypothetical protein EXIGLDRAFT_420762 [Exidia glandulosa HHB12029]